MTIVPKKEEPSDLAYQAQEDYIATLDWVSDNDHSGSDTERDTDS